jgi:hypothetical protein
MGSTQPPLPRLRNRRLMRSGRVLQTPDRHLPPAASEQPPMTEVVFGGTIASLKGRAQLGYALQGYTYR